HWTGLRAIFQPGCAVDVPHVPDTVAYQHERIAHEKRLVWRRGHDGTGAEPREGTPLVITDRAAYRRLHRDGHPATPSARERLDGTAGAQHVHRKDAMLVETSERTKRNHGVGRGADHTSKRSVDVNERHAAHVLPAGVAAARRKINAHETLEDEGLRCLRKRRTAVWQRIPMRFKQQSQFGPFHDRSPSSAARPKPCRPTSLPR